jgi:hypothetical protein
MCQWKLYVLLAAGFVLSAQPLLSQQTDREIDSLPSTDTISSLLRYIPSFTADKVQSGSDFLIAAMVVSGNKKTR